MQTGSFILATVLVSVATAAFGTEDAVCSHAPELKFPPGKTSTVVTATVARENFKDGCLTFLARKGQVLDIRATADSTDNTTIMVFEPGYAPKRDDDFSYIDGPMLPGAGRGDNARKIHAVLPASGRYLVMAGPAFGGAAGFTYRLSIR